MADNLEAVGLEFDTTQFERAIRRAEQRLDGLEKSIDQSGAAAKRAEGSFLSTGRAIVGLVAAYGGFRVIRNTARFIFDTNAEFQQLEARLVSITGSTERAATAFSFITEFARSTPFEVSNLTEAFTILRAAGIEPTAEMMEGIGNFAAAMGRDITDAVEAIVRGAQGGTERLRESFFVPIKKDGEEFVIAFDGVERRVAANTKSMVGFFTELGKTRFASGMEVQMNTIGGTLSNLADSTSLWAKEIGDDGLNAELVETIRLLDEMVQREDGLASFFANAAKWALDTGQAFIKFPGIIDFEMKRLARVFDPPELTAYLKALRATAGFTGPPLPPDFNPDGSRRVPDVPEPADDFLNPPGPTREQLAGLDALRYEAIAEGAERARESVKQLEKAWEDITRTEQQHEAAVEQLLGELERERIALTQGETAAFEYGLTLEGWKDAEIDAASAAFQANQALLDQAEAAEAAIEEMEQWTLTITDGLLDVILSTEDAAEAFGRMIDSIIRDLAREELQRGLFNLLGLLGGGGGGGGVAGGVIEAGDAGDVLPGGGIFAAASASAAPRVVHYQTVNLSLNAIDGRSAARFLEENKGTLAGLMMELRRESSLF